MSEERPPVHADIENVIDQRLEPIGVSADGRLRIGDVRRAQIIRIVRSLIAREGVRAVTVSRIAAELGTSRGVVGHHFEDKNEIMRAALSNAVRDANRTTSRAIESSADLGELVGAVASLRSPEYDWWPIYLAFLAESGREEFYRDQIAAADEAHRTHLEKFLVEPGRASLILGIMKGLAMQRLASDDFDLAGAVAAAGELLESWNLLSVNKPS